MFNKKTLNIENLINRVINMDESKEEIYICLNKRCNKVYYDGKWQRFRLPTVKERDNLYHAICESHQKIKRYTFKV